MGSAVAVRRKLVAVKAKAREAGRRAKGKTVAAAQKARPKRTPTRVPATPPPEAPPLDPARAPVVHVGDQRVVRPANANRPVIHGPVPPLAPPPVAVPVLMRDSERSFTQAQLDQDARFGRLHWLWSALAYLTFLAMATQAASAMPSDPSDAEQWRSFGLWSFFVVAAACVLVLSWRNLALPALMVMFGVFLLAWRAPFLAMGIFSDAADWTTKSVPWWSLLTITFVTKALETRGGRRRYHLRTLMVLQGMQIATYAVLVLLSIFFLGRNGTIPAGWTITIVALVAAWMFQGRSLLAMWNRTVPPPTAAASASLWSSNAEHTGK
jgi:hypothetical protein